ncbi:MAG TPA: hypothetical protein VFT64_02760 [Rickettsiales bacterium]|nr:hypothetical protein [Rickettsiales bacterium]
MAENIITLKVEKLAGLGDGMGMHNGRKVFLPYVCTGDTVRARIIRRTTDADYAQLVEVISPSPERIAPPCPHFGICGGCTLQHISDTAYAEFKQTMAREAVRKAGFDPNLTVELARFPAGSRRRVELKAAGGKLGFYAEGSHTIIDIGECMVLEPELLSLIMRLKLQLISAPGTTRLQINGVDGGYDLLLEGAAKIDPSQSPEIRRISVRENNKIRIVYESGPVIMTLAGAEVEVPPGAFLQASRDAQALMTNLVVQAAAGCVQILDLFSGIGTYSFPLLASASVTAVEGEQSMVEAMKKVVFSKPPAALLSAPEEVVTVAPVRTPAFSFKALQRDLFQRPYTAAELKPYDIVIINPPRAGAKAQAEELAASQVPKIVMVSCNPATFTRDARLLKAGGYELVKLTPVDQFVYSSHLELVAEFEK